MTCTNLRFWPHTLELLVGGREPPTGVRQSKHWFAGWTKVLVAASMAGISCTVYPAVDPAAQWSISWTSTVSGGGVEDVGGYHLESSISGDLSVNYLVDVLEDLRVLDGSLVGNWMSRDYSGGIIVCGQGDTLGEALVSTENTGTTTWTGSADNADVSISEFEQPSGLHTVQLHINSESNYTSTDRLAQIYIVENCITDNYEEINPSSGVSRVSPPYLLRGGELVAEDDRNLVFTGSFSNTEYVDRYRGPVTQTYEARAEKIPANVVRGLEVNQVVQDLYNSVPLVEDKTTWVRATIESPVLRHVRAVLRGFDSLGNELPDSPLQAVNTSGGVYAKPDSADHRDWDWSTLNFRLPSSWTRSSNGKIEIRLDPLPDQGVLCGGNCSVLATFNPVGPLDVRFVRVKYSDGTDTTQPTTHDIRIVKRRLRGILPISSLSKLRPKVTSWSGDLTGGPEKGETLLIKLNILQMLNCWENPSECRQVYHGVILGNFGGIAYIPGNASWSGLVRGGIHGRNTPAHEIGHNLGLPHPVNSWFGTVLDKNGRELLRGPCGSTAETTTSDFPFIFDYDDFPSDAPLLPWFDFSKGPPGSEDLRAAIGPMANNPINGSTYVDYKELVYGVDFYPPVIEPRLTNARVPWIVDPADQFALMSYCGDGYRWVSRDNYDLLMTEINRRSSTPATTASALSAGDYLLVHGSVDYVNHSLELAPVRRVSTNGTPSPTEPGEFILGWLDGAGNILGTISFGTQHGWPDAPVVETGVENFFIAIPADPAIRQIAVVHEDAPDTILDSLSASAHAPSVQILAPNGGEVLPAVETQVNWSAADADGDSLTYLIQFSGNNGSSWQTLDTGLTETSYTVDLSQLQGTTEGLFKIQASDGLLTSSDESDAVFTVASQPPSVYLVEPEDEATFFGKQLVALEAEAEDAEDGVLDGASLEWVSSLDGSLGTGQRLSRRADELSEGVHLISVTVTDSDGEKASDAVQVRIREDASIADLTLNLDGPAGDVLNLGEQGAYRLTITNNGPDAASDLFLNSTFGEGLALVTVTPNQGECVEQVARIECSLDILGVGSNMTVDLLVEASAVDTIPLEALVISDAFDGTLENNQVSRSVEIVSQSMPGDLNGDNDLDADDRAILRASLGSCTGDARFTSQADYDSNGCIDYSDYRAWYNLYKLYLSGSN
jgi:uncharacterized repeat protein (TIGR01451 family)